MVTLAVRKEMFESLDPGSRIWIFQSASPVAEALVPSVDQGLYSFVAQWKSHGAPVKGDAIFLESHFIIFAADERFASVGGCSADTLHQLIAEVNKVTGCDFFERLLIPVEFQDGWQFLSKKAILQKIQAGTLSPDAKMLDHTVSTLRDWQDYWVKSIQSSWLNRFLPTSEYVQE
jgi:hypothetical protein